MLTVHWKADLRFKLNCSVHVIWDYPLTWRLEGFSGKGISVLKLNGDHAGNLIPLMADKGAGVADTLGLRATLVPYVCDGPAEGDLFRTADRMPFISGPSRLNVSHSTMASSPR